MDLDTLEREDVETLLRDELIERLRAEASIVSSLTVDPLKGFCEIQMKRTPNIPFPTAGGKIAWDTLLEIQGWKVQSNKITRHIRILDDRNVRRAWGDGKMLLELYRYLLRLHSKQYHSKVVPDLGIVFCGGGAKGAYQIGVWRRLRELGLEARINGVSGASVGALNSLLFAQGDLDLAEKVWFGIKEEDMKQLNSKLAASAAGGIGGIGIGALGGIGAFIVSPLYAVLGLLQAMPVGLILTGFMVLSEGLFSRNYLEDTIKQYISEDKVMDSNKRVYTAITMPSLPSLREDKARPQKIYGRVEYRCWDGLTFPEIKSCVFASSAFPLAYGPVEIDGDLFIDGGAVDNEPVYPLAEAGFSAVIVVHLTPPEKIEEKRKIQKRIDTIAENVRVFHVWPSKPIGETFEISQELTRERMALGYADACAQLKGLTGPTSTRN